MIRGDLFPVKDGFAFPWGRETVATLLDKLECAEVRLRRAVDEGDDELVIHCAEIISDIGALIAARGLQAQRLAAR